MIGYLKGTLVSKRPPELTVDVGGIGYDLHAPMSTFYRLPEPGKPLVLITHLLVREDAHVLYGFSTEAERALFRTLLKVFRRGCSNCARDSLRDQRGGIPPLRAGA